MKKICINWIKMSLAVIAAIELAMFFKLEFSISAGIIALLTIQPTKKETIRTALGRLIAFAVALLIAAFCFFILGVTQDAFLVYIIVYILVCYLFGWINYISVSSVLVSHFISYGVMDFYTVTNEIMIFSVGVITGIIANLHLRKKVNYIEQMKSSTDEYIKKILYLISKRITSKESKNSNEHYFVSLEKLIRDAKNLAEENYNNQFGKSDIFDIEYIAMRERQYIVLYEMYKDVCKIKGKPITAEKVARFFSYMADTFDKNNDGKAMLQQFIKMDMYMKEQKLPDHRQEFEDRARLFNLMRKIEEFIQIKIEFYEKRLGYSVDEKTTLYYYNTVLKLDTDNNLDSK